MYSELPHTYLQIDDGQSYLEDPPETPAPLFAVRAFKTAIFGTPHPNQGDELNDEKRPAHLRAVKVEETLQQHQTPHETPQDLGLNTELNYKPKTELLASPAKGILLTPGTAAARKKTVSFGGLANNLSGERKRELHEIKIGDDTSSSDQSLVPTQTLRSEPKNQSSLTKTLFKAQLEESKKRLSVEGDCEKSAARASLGDNKNHLEVGTANEKEVHDLAADTTVDLSQPRSRSGQHWKAEYELYHKNSSREMKKVIKYGQNAKSYALKKDSEATILADKLKKELSKVAAMEAKVSQLATQITNARQGSSDEGADDQSKLMSDLAKQTALAVRHKQKAEGYRRTIEMNKTLVAPDAGQDDNFVQQVGKELSQKRPSTIQVLNKTPPELLSLRTELETFKENFRFTEEKAAQLEAENMTLKRSLARVKEEMDSYEKRRLAREQRLKNREARLQQENQEYERKLAETTREYEWLLSQANQHSKEPDVVNSLAEQSRKDGDAVRHVEVRLRERTSVAKELGSSDASHGDYILTSPKRRRHHDNKSPESRVVRERLPKSPLRDIVRTPPDDAKSTSPKLPANGQHRNFQTSDVDVWMIGSPGDEAPNTSLSKGLAQSSHFDLLRNGTNDALQEIDQNLVLKSSTNDQIPSHRLGNSVDKVSSPPNPPRMDSSVLPALPSCEPFLSSAVRRMRERRINISSPRPSIVNFTSSPPQRAPSSTSFQPARASDDKNTEQRYSSIVSSSSRTSTMTSAQRRSALPADRVAAAKARLQRRSMEKQKLRDKSKAVAEA